MIDRIRSKLKGYKLRSNSVVLALLCATFSGSALAQSGSDEWPFQLTPYLWLPTIDGTLNYLPPPGGSGAPVVSVGPTDWLKLINAGLLLNGSARKDCFSVFTDVVDLSLQDFSFCGPAFGVRFRF